VTTAVATVRYLEVEPGATALRSGSPSPLPDGWARVRVGACGVCGTDLHLLGGMPLPRDATYPVRPGHEVAGTVIEGGGGRIGPGDDVVLHPLLPCGRCPACRGGRENRCRSATALGLDHDGGLADEVVWPADRMIPAPGIPVEQAAVLADAVASAHHALRLAELPRGGALTVLGAGGVGAHVLQLARALDPDARLTAVVRSEASARRLRELGIDVMIGAEHVLEASGPQDAVVEFGAGVEHGLRMLARGGRLVIGSMGQQPLELATTLTAIATRELHVVGTYASTVADLRIVVDLVMDGRLDLSRSVSHRVPLDRAGEALELIERRPPGFARAVVIP
jgi:D-arabinose 1-dehydrogenase-like Zn-dependent alcohol dehydrogenase